MTISEPGINVEDIVLERSAIDKAITSLKEHPHVTKGDDVRIDGHGKDYVFICPLPGGFAEVWEYTGENEKKRVTVSMKGMYKKDTFDHYYGLATGEIESPF